MTPVSPSTGTDVSVVVIGAGYAGVMATNRLLASLNRVEADRDDFLIYAPGNAAATPIPGAREHAHLLANLDGAQCAAQQLTGSVAGSRVVVGGGLTGVEAAAEIAEQRPGSDVTLLSSGSVATQMQPHARRSIRRALTSLGIHLVEDANADRITNRAVILSDGRTVGFDTCVVALSFTAPDLARASGLRVDHVGRLCVDETRRCTDAPAIIGAGDAIVTPDSVGAHLRMSCAAALPLGGHAADTVLHLIRGQEPIPISIGFVVQCLSLGRKDGYIQLVRPDDSARAGRLIGRKPAWVKERICRLVVEGPKKEARRPSAYRIAKGPRRSPRPPP